MKRPTLKRAAKANPEGIYRLAIFLGLTVTGMKPKQVAHLIAWRLHPNRQWGR